MTFLSDTKNRSKILIPLFIINLIFYLYVILNIEKLMLDDYVIFSIIKDNPGRLISFNVNDDFFLFFRPLTYILMYIFFYFFNLNALLIKVINLIVLFALLYFAYLFIERLSEKKTKDLPPVYIFLLLLTLSLSFYSFMSVIWISNSNELYMLLFYLVSLNCLMLYVKGGSKKYLFLYFIFYVASVLFKQTSLHLPFLVLLFIYYNKNKLERKKFNNIVKVSSIAAVFAILFFALNIIPRSNSAFFLTEVWKKPFSLIGNVLILLFPSLGDSIYSNFIVNKIYAFIVGLIVISFIIFILVYKRKQLNYRLIFTFFLGVVIIFLPKIFGETEVRPLFLQFFWVVLLLYFFIERVIINGKIKILFVVVFFVYNLFGLNSNYNKFKLSLNYSEKQLNSFVNEIGTREQNSYNEIYILLCYDSSIFPYYLRNYYNEIGRDSVIVSPFNLSYFKISDEEKNMYSVVDLQIKDNEVEVKVTNKNFYLEIDERAVTNSGYEITQKVKSNVRGFSNLKFLIPDNVIKKSQSMVYYDGVEWKRIN